MFGSGYVGLVTGVCFADHGNDVICVDIDKKKIESLSKGEIPIYEPGLKELLERSLKQGRILFTTDAEKAIQDSEILFITVGTPQETSGKADLSYVLDVAKTIGKHINGYKIIVDKSTVPVGTADRVTREIRSSMKKKCVFDVVSNPEFLKEGAAIKDFQNPDRVVIGCSNDRPKEKMKQLYKPMARANRPILFMSVKSAELTKYASNAMLATRISFMNELSHLCEEIGADIKQVAKGMGMDTRIGSRFLSAGVGYGGSCFPKDVRALAHVLEVKGHKTNILRAVDYANELQKKSVVPKLKKLLKNLDGKKIAIWGLSFKPKTDDMREAPSLTVIDQLQDEYAHVSAYDPESMENAKKYLSKVSFTATSYEALKEADALIILTEWDEFRSPDFEKMKKLMKQSIIIDGRNIYDPDEITKLGFNYVGIGRS